MDVSEDTALASREGVRPIEGSGAVAYALFSFARLRAMTTTYHFVSISLREGSIFLLDVEDLAGVLSISNCDMLSIVGG